MKKVDNSKGGYFVTGEFRTNPLSTIPGGSTLKVNHIEAPFKIYDNIKNVRAYINAIVKDKSISSIEVNNEIVWQRNTQS